MLTVDDVLPLLGNRLDEHRIESLFGERGQKMATEARSFPPRRSAALLLPAKFRGSVDIRRQRGILATIFLFIEGDEGVSSYPWSFRNGLNPSSTEEDVIAAMGLPKSGKADVDDGFATVRWDRYKLPKGLLHFQYDPEGNGISMVTAMLAGPAANDA